MRCRGKIVTSHENPRIIADALRPDNTKCIKTSCKGKKVITEFNADEIGTLIASVDDYLLNLQIAEEMSHERS